MRKAWLLICIVGIIVGVQLQTGYAQSRYGKALDLADSGKWEEAIQELQEIIRDDEADQNVYLALGILSEKSGRDLQALEALLNAQEIDPEMVSAAFALGLLYEKLKMPKKAVAEWKTFIQLSKDKELLHVAKKHILFLEKK